MTNLPANSTYAFDDFHLDGDKLMLYRAGEPVRLPPKAVATLVALVQNRGQILSKDDLMEAVWKGSVVEESNLTQYLYLLRKELGSRAGGTPYIETLRKRGYRFDADRFHSLGKETEVQPAREAAFSVPAKYPYAVAATAVLIVAAVSAALWSGLNKAADTARTEQLEVIRLTNGLEINDAAISPDGNYFAYNEIDGARSRIWVQQTGQTTRREIVPWVDRWHGPKTFTPDGRFLYYLESDGGSAGSLLRVPTLGGNAVKLLTGINSPVTFSPDGREFAYFRQTPADHGAEILIRQADGSGPERSILSWHGAKASTYVAWSPDGKSIAFTAQGYFEPSERIYIGVVDLATGEIRKLFEEPWDNCYRVEWDPHGLGLFAVATRIGDGYTTRRDQLYYIPLRDEKPRQLTHDGSRLQLSSLSVTRAGSVLVVPFNRSSQIWSMSAGGESHTAVQLTTGLADGRAGIAPLADGRIAYVARAGENLNIWTMQPDGTEQMPLTAEPEFVEEVRASGDGRFLFFSAPNGKRNDLFRINADGSGLTQVTFDRHVIDSGTSHDGKLLAYDVTSGTAPEITLWKTAIDGGEPVKLKTEGCGRPHFSPDDNFISCVRRDESISILSAADGTLLNSFSAAPRATLHFGARWTPDGKALAYIVTEKDVSNIWIQPVDGSPPRRLTDFTVGSIYHFVFSRDGERLYLARGTQIRDALLISTSR